MNYSKHKNLTNGNQLTAGRTISKTKNIDWHSSRETDL